MTHLDRAIKILQYFHQNPSKLIDRYDKFLQETLDIGHRQLGRELDTISNNFNNIALVKNNRKKAYKLIKPIDILNESYKNSFKLGFVFEMAKDITPEILEEWNKISKEEDKPYIFYNMPFEDIKKVENSEVFKLLLRAIKTRREVNISSILEEYISSKPIKILFSEGNWYIAHINSNRLYITRIQFINSVTLTKNNRTFQSTKVQKHIKWLNSNYQNPFSLEHIKPKEAKIYATPNIARYFKKGMKKFFKSQKFVKITDDGGVIFTIKYTQELEILPFVQKWLPDLIILEPLELKEAYVKKLKKAINNSKSLNI
jgi:hypothetical protein